jgi:hypothetical protein
MPLRTSPQQRSNLARKAAHTRWSAQNVGADGIRPFRPSAPSNRQSRTAKSWISSRFCLRIEQDPAGEWFLLTPSGIRLPASPAEISLWLDIPALKYLS